MAYSEDKSPMIGRMNKRKSVIRLLSAAVMVSIVICFL